MTVKVAGSNPIQTQIRIGEPMGEIRVSVKLINAVDDQRAAAADLPLEHVRSLVVDALVDTGAVRSVLPQEIVNRLGLQIRSKESVEYADNRREVVGLTGAVIFEILGRSTSDEALVLGNEVLIGQTILEKLDLLADCSRQRLIPNPDHPNHPVSKVK
jgi:clan AA aspartic protease